MKTLRNFKTVCLQAVLIGSLFIGITSCSESSETKDSKEVAEDYNDAKFGKKSQEKDAQFLVNAAEINLDEIALGKLAQQKGIESDIKSMGKMMEDEHTKSLADLTALAAKKSITIPTSPSEKANDVYKKMNEKSGKDFGKEYSDLMVNGHKDAIAAFENALSESDDADIKNWASATLPTLRMHLEHAMHCQSMFEKK